MTFVIDHCRKDRASQSELFTLKILQLDSEYTFSYW